MRASGIYRGHTSVNFFLAVEDENKLGAIINSPAMNVGVSNDANTILSNETMRK